MSPDIVPLDAAGTELQPAGGLCRRSRAQQRGGEQATRPQGRPARLFSAVHAGISGCRRFFVKPATRFAALALIASGLLAGCTAPKLVYDQLDVLLPWYFRDYVDLDTGQRQQLRRSVDTLLAWHRESEMGRYAAFFRELERDAAVPLGRERLGSARLELESFWDDAMRQLAPDAAALLSSLDDGQVQALFERIELKDQQEAEEALARSDAERRSRREKTLRKQLERWVGRLDASQRALVADCAASLQADPAGWFASRRAWQAALRQALAVRDDLPAFTSRLERLLADGESFWDPAYRARFQADRERVLQLLADVDASLSPDQRVKLRERLGAWALDLETIAGGA